MRRYIHVTLNECIKCTHTHMQIHTCTQHNSFNGTIVWQLLATFLCICFHRCMYLCVYVSLSFSLRVDLCLYWMTSSLYSTHKNPRHKPQSLQYRDHIKKNKVEIFKHASHLFACCEIETKFNSKRVKIFVHFIKWFVCLACRT